MNSPYNVLSSIRSSLIFVLFRLFDIKTPQSVCSVYFSRFGAKVFIFSVLLFYYPSRLLSVRLLSVRLLSVRLLYVRLLYVKLLSVKAYFTVRQDLFRISFSLILPNCFLTNLITR
jgi:hypothetical protein